MVKDNKIVKEVDIIQKAEEALRACLEGPPFVQSVRFERELSRDGFKKPDLAARVTTPEGEKMIVAEVKSNGQPRYAREAANQLTLYTQKSSDSYGVFIAPYISPVSGWICRQAGIGYADLAGNCFISFERVFISIEGKPNPFPQARDLRTIFSPAASRVIRALLVDPYIAWKIENLSRKAGVSIGLVAKVKKILLDREWATEKDVGFALTKPKDAIQEWASQYNYRRNRVKEFYSLKDEPTIEQELRDYCSGENIQLALTLFSGASRVAPYTKFKGVFAYVGTGTEDIENALGLRTVTTGPNVILLEPYDKGVFYNSTYYNQMPVVSPIQLYLDLKGYKGRGEDAAQFLFDQVIEPLWLQKQTTEKEK